MRLDEAESGIRTDLGIKVVGPDLERTPSLAERILRIVAGSPGRGGRPVEIADGTGQYRVRRRPRCPRAPTACRVAEVQRGGRSGHGRDGSRQSWSTGRVASASRCGYPVTCIAMTCEALEAPDSRTTPVALVPLHVRSRASRRCPRDPS
jgi:hypothetical protein